MKRLISILILVGVVALVVIQLAQNKKDGENRIFVYNKEVFIPVFGEVISDKNQSSIKTYSGVFESVNEVKVGSDTQGKITDVFVNEGQKVKRGQRLVKIDITMLQLQLNVIDTKLDGLKKDEQRYVNLSVDDAIPAVKLEKIQNAIETLEAERATISEQINKSTIKAPFDGVVSMKLCEKGGFASPAIPLFEIINLSDLKFVINVPEEELAFFTKEVEYLVSTKQLGDKPIVARLGQVSSKGGIGNSFKIEFLVDKTSLIKPKMKGELSFTSKQLNTKNLSIPSSAILGSESNPEVYLIRNEKVQRTAVNVKSRNGDRLTVAGDLNVGDTIVTGGFINLFDNANVSVNL